MDVNRNTLIEKIQTLSAEQIDEVENLVESLRLRGQGQAWARTTAAVSEAAFAAVWNNPEDAGYDAL